MQKNATEAAAKWARNMGAAGETIRAGVLAVTQSPTQAAAANAAGYVSGVQRAVESGKWQAGLNSVSLPDWQRATIDVGLQRLQTGAAKAKDKVKAFLDEWLPWEEQGKAALASTPRGGLEQNMQRALIMMRHNAAFRRQRRR